MASLVYTDCLICCLCCCKWYWMSRSASEWQEDSGRRDSTLSGPGSGSASVTPGRRYSHPPAYSVLAGARPCSEKAFKVSVHAAASADELGWASVCARCRCCLSGSVSVRVRSNTRPVLCAALGEPWSTRSTSGHGLAQKQLGAARGGRAGAVCVRDRTCKVAGLPDSGGISAGSGSAASSSLLCSSLLRPTREWERQRDEAFVGGIGRWSLFRSRRGTRSAFSQMHHAARQSAHLLGRLIGCIAAGFVAIGSPDQTEWA
ncbi:hypothetical protein J3F83DRAFT_650909 [Trichoderma novae-zelandiae]